MAEAIGSKRLKERVCEVGASPLRRLERASTSGRSVGGSRGRWTAGGGPTTFDIISFNERQRTIGLVAGARAHELSSAAEQHGPTRVMNDLRRRVVWDASRKIVTRPNYTETAAA